MRPEQRSALLLLPLLLLLLLLGATATAAADADVCALPFSQLFLRDATTPTARVPCLQTNGSIDARCLTRCACRELQSAPSVAGVCVGTSAATGCQPTATRRQCPTSTTAAPTTSKPPTVTTTKPPTATMATATEPPTPTTQLLNGMTAAAAGTETAPQATPSAPTPPAMANNSNASSDSGGTDRTTMIVVVACVVGVFALVVVFAIVRAHRRQKGREGHATVAEPTTPPLEGGSHAYSAAPATLLKVRARPTHVTPFKPAGSGVFHDARPSQTHTERTTLGSSHRGSSDEVLVLESGSRDFDNDQDDDELAMLESYAHTRRFQDESFRSAVPFDDSSRSLDIDASRRSAGVYDTTLSTASSAYWRYPEDTTFYVDEDEDDAPQQPAPKPRPQKGTSVDL